MRKQIQTNQEKNLISLNCEKRKHILTNQNDWN